jgi:hypothetical protein
MEARGTIPPESAFGRSRNGGNLNNIGGDGAKVRSAVPRIEITKGTNTMLSAIKDWFQLLLLDVIWGFSHLLVLGGLSLILIQVLIDHGMMSSVFTEHALDLIGPYVAALSVLLVAVAIYFERAHRTPPTDSTKKIVSPILIVLSLVFLTITFIGVQFSSRYVDALGAIALGGAMARLTGIPFKISN